MPGVVADAYGLDSRTDIVDHPRHRGHRVPRRPAAHVQLLHLQLPHRSLLHGAHRGAARAGLGALRTGAGRRHHQRRVEAPAGGAGERDHGRVRHLRLQAGEVRHDGLADRPTANGPIGSPGSARDADTQVDYVEDDRYAIQPAITFRPDSDTSDHGARTFPEGPARGSTRQFFPHIGTIYPNVNGRRIPQDRFVGEPGRPLRYRGRLRHAARRAQVQLGVQAAARLALCRHPQRLRQHLRSGWIYLDPADQEQVTRTGGWPSPTRRSSTRTPTSRPSSQPGPLSHRVLGGVDYSHFKASADLQLRLRRQSFQRLRSRLRPGSNGWSGTATVNRLCPGRRVSRSAHSARPDRHADRRSTSRTRCGSATGSRSSALRKDWLDNDAGRRPTAEGRAITYRAGLMYEFASGLTPYVSYAQIVRARRRPQRRRQRLRSATRAHVRGWLQVPAGRRQLRHQRRGLRHRREQPARVRIRQIRTSARRPARSPSRASRSRRPARSPRTSRSSAATPTRRVQRRIRLSGDHVRSTATSVESVPEHLASLWGV